MIIIFAHTHVGIRMYNIVMFVRASRKPLKCAKVEKRTQFFSTHRNVCTRIVIQYAMNRDEINYNNIIIYYYAWKMGLLQSPLTF